MTQATNRSAPRRDASDVVVETRNLSKVYRDFWGRSKKTALKPLDLDVRRGEIFGLLGPNGAGKTTTLKLLLGLIFPTSGEALVFGRAATDVSKNERIGYLPEESYLYKFLDAEETLDFYGRLFGLDPEERRQRAATLIEMVGLTRDRKRQLREYSKGMTRRIGVAQALINDPELVILDEPTSGLDPIGTREMKDLIIDLKARGKTVIMCSHLLADVEDVCDRIAVLHQGELKELGRVEDLLRVTGVTQIRATGLSPAAAAEVRDRIQSSSQTALFLSVGAVLLSAWGEARAMTLTASRRLSLAAQAGTATLFLARAGAVPAPSAALTRWSVGAAPSTPLEAGAPGRPSFSATLLRHRGGVEPGTWIMEWDRERRAFLERSPVSGAVVPVAAERTPATWRTGERRVA